MTRVTSSRKGVREKIYLIVPSWCNANSTSEKASWFNSFDECVEFQLKRDIKEILFFLCVIGGS